MTSMKVEFPGHSGARLDGRLELPLTAPRAYAVFAHCFTCGKDLLAAVRIARALSDRGIAVLRFDFTGLGMSGGDFAETNFSSNVADLASAADFLRDNYQAPALLIGHSLGGAAVLAAAGDMPTVKAVATIAAPSEATHVLHLLGDSLQSLRDRNEVEVELVGRKFRIRRQLLEDLEQARLSERISNLGKALLVMHSEADDIVEIEHATKIFRAARAPKSFVMLDGADHLLSRREDAEYAAHVLAAWAERYLPEMATPTRTESGAVEVAETRNGKFVNTVHAGRHILYADEPLDAGGDDVGPSPYEYLLASLGSCTSMTLRLYAQHKDMPLEHVSVRLRHRRIHARDCEDCETTEAQISEIEREIHLQGNLDEAQRRRLLEIAEKCPVHRTLTGVVKVRSRLSEE